MKRIEKRIDVSGSAGLGPRVEMAVTVVLPDPAALGDRPVAIFAAPGGGYSRAYFDLCFDDHAGYSEAEYHAARGMIHVAVDHVGVGESNVPDLSAITFQTLAATHDDCVRQISALLTEGGLDPDFPPCPSLFKVGMGQSMGGGVTILAQGRFATFDAIAPCGVSAIHTALPQRDGEAFEHGKRRFESLKVGDNRSSHMSVEHEGVDYVYPFHWEDVPADILALDMAGGYPIRTTAPVFGSLTIPHCAVQMMTPGCFSEDAARINVPVFIGLGQRDTCPDPHAEPSAYRASSAICLRIVPRMAHMHNFASTRKQLWSHLHGWARLSAESIPDDAAPPLS